MTARFLVSGLVQGVGFRHFVSRHAGRIGIAGWVQNLADGRVEVVAQGQQSSIDLLEVELRLGPRAARVETVFREEVSDEVVTANTFAAR